MSQLADSTERGDSEDLVEGSTGPLVDIDGVVSG
jgi:hypothetical protein